MLAENSLTEKLAISSVGNGWKKLVKDFYSHVINLKSTVHIVQIKEKFGSIRIYADVDYENQVESEYKELYDYIAKLEVESKQTCEECGEAGSTRPELYWLKTLCEAHFKERMDDLKARSLV